MIRPDERLSGRARRVRVVAGSAVVVLLLAGTAVGQDDHFPFGPFRMYATRQRLDGTTSWYSVEAVDEAGRLVRVPSERFGLRRSELEGQVDRFRADPTLLGALAAAYDRRQPHAAALVEIHLVRNRQRLAGGRPTGPVTQVVEVTWRR